MSRARVTPERIEAIRALWCDGKSATEVAVELRLDSKNVVIGIVHRYGATWPQRKKTDGPKVRHSNHRLDRAKIANTRLRRAAPPSLPTPAAPIVSVAVTPLTLLDLRTNQCRWPMHGVGISTLFCGDTRQDGKSYCQRHAALAFRRVAA